MIYWFQAFLSGVVKNTLISSIRLAPDISIMTSSSSYGTWQELWLMFKPGPPLHAIVTQYPALRFRVAVPSMGTGSKVFSL